MTLIGVADRVKGALAAPEGRRTGERAGSEVAEDVGPSIGADHRMPRLVPPTEADDERTSGSPHQRGSGSPLTLVTETETEYDVRGKGSNKHGK